MHVTVTVLNLFNALLPPVYEHKKRNTILQFKIYFAKPIEML